MKELEYVFGRTKSKAPTSFKYLKKRIKNVLKDNSSLTEQQLSILQEIYRKRDLLFGYLVFKHSKQGSKYPLKYLPRTTNIIESYNSHLNSRLKSLRGFESFKTANIWLNAYFLRRRLKSFTDCRGKFRYLNKKCSLQLTLSKRYNKDRVLEEIKKMFEV